MCFFFFLIFISGDLLCLDTCEISISTIFFFLKIKTKNLFCYVSISKFSNRGFLY